MVRLAVIAFTTNFAVAVATCIGNGQNGTAIWDALNQGGSGAIVERCPGAVIPIYQSIGFTADSQIVHTQGRPTGSKRAILRITVLPGQETPPAIFDMCTPGDFGPVATTYPNLGLRNIILDGNRQVQGNPLSAPLPVGYDSTVVMGGGTSGHFVDHVELRNNRGSGCIYVEPTIYDGEDGNGNYNISVTNSVFQNCTTGISLDGFNTLIANNKFYLGSGIGIEVIYNSVGTNITNNVFSATEAPNLALAGIALGNYNGNGYYN